MKKIGLIFPHQLFSKSEIVAKCEKVYILEDELFFGQYKFHKQKLILHRASMKYFEEKIARNLEVEYIELGDKRNYSDIIRSHKSDEIHYYQVDDYLLDRRLTREFNKQQSNYKEYTNLNFVNTQEGVKQVLENQKNYFMANFYSHSRKKYNILIDNDGKPTGGKWSFDADNRKKVPKNVSIPSFHHPKENKYVKEAKSYISKHFENHYGEAEPFYYPTTHKEAEARLAQFIQDRFEKFGDYEDAMVAEENWLWHSVLTPALNIGLLNPKQVINEVLIAHRKRNFPLNSLEGFIRQILGWREFIRGIYALEGTKQRTTNHFRYTRKIPETFWSGETGIAPLDSTIQKLLKTGYTHHIERLMLFGNFMMLCEFDPDEVYRWFMEMYVDSYDWVMVPNVYGMTQYADGGLMTTKPYCSSSNYILKMSNFKKGDWCQIWDGLYWRFIHVNREEFSKNRRMSMMINLLNKMDREKLNNHLETAENYLKSLDK